MNYYIGRRTSTASLERPMQRWISHLGGGRRVSLTYKTADTISYIRFTIVGVTQEDAELYSEC
jgi:hypothetical protein